MSQFFEPSLLERTDVYKFGHKDQYPPGTTQIVSYLECRGSENDASGAPLYGESVFFGLQYYLEKYLSKCPTTEDVDEWFELAEHILGKGNVSRVQADQLVALGYIPIEIKAVPEGTVVYPLGNVLMTITNTHPDFFWLVNYIESLLMKVWSPMSVATNSLKFRRLFEEFAEKTCDDNSHVDFQMHDFGYRGTSSDESAGIQGAAHLTSFLGTDTAVAVRLCKNYYGEFVGHSVPASEHSVMCAWSKNNNDSKALENMLKVYPTGIVSVVSDTYDLWKAIAYYGRQRRSTIEQREGKVVIRPDSGYPVDIICGTKWYERLHYPNSCTPEELGVIRYLEYFFGSTTNSKGYKVLPPHIGCIYGDGITYSRARMILERLDTLGYASSNIVFGSGGLLLNSFSRDTLKVAIKASYAIVDGEARDLVKSPVTDPGKKSKAGNLSLHRNVSPATYVTMSNFNNGNDLLKTVYKDGLVASNVTMTEIRTRVRSSLKGG